MLGPKRPVVLNDPVLYRHYGFITSYKAREDFLMIGGHTLPVLGKERASSLRRS